MKYYFTLLALYYFSGTAQASGVLPIDVPPRPIADSLHHDTPAGVENNSTLTRDTAGSLEARDYVLPMSDLTKFFERGKHNTIKKFSWQGFRYQLSMSKCYVPLKYRVHSFKPGKNYLGDVDLELLEANVRDLVGAKIKTMVPENVVDFQLADFFETDSERGGVGRFVKAEFEYFFDKGQVQIPARFKKQNGKLDVDALYEAMDELGRSTEKHMEPENTFRSEEDMERVFKERWKESGDWEKIPYEESDPRGFTLRDFFAENNQFPKRIGHFRFDAFRKHWNARRVWVNQKYLTPEGELDLHALDTFIRRLEGSNIKSYGLPKAKMAPDEPEIMEPTEQPHFNRPQPFSPENVPSKEVEDAGRLSARVETSSRFGRLKFKIPRGTKPVGIASVGEIAPIGEAVVDGEPLERLSPSRISQLGARLSSAIEFSFLNIAIGVTLIAIPIALGFMIEGIVKLVEHKCEEKHGGPEGCARHHDENLFLREKKINDGHLEAEHKGEHKKEEAKIKDKHERHEARKRHRAEEKQEKKDHAAARKKEKEDFDARDRANREMDDMVNHDLQEMAKYEQKHNHHKRFEVFGSMVDFEGHQIDHAMTWFSDYAEDGDEDDGDEDGEWPSRD